VTRRARAVVLHKPLKCSSLAWIGLLSV
jgi:hypothetical protein